MSEAAYEELFTKYIGEHPEECCYFCGCPLVNGECPAYDPHDFKHLKNRAALDAGEKPAPREIPHIEAVGPCWVCGSPVDEDGRCTFEKDFTHNHPADEALWRKLFHTRRDAENAPPVTFLIDGFLQREGVTAIAGPVRERKSLIALNVAHALVTGEKLFDHFVVVKQPKRVLYLCPEMSLGPFTDRLKKMRLVEFVGERLFYRTLSADGRIELDDESLESALPDSVVILDTAIRFLTGDENSSKDVRRFADSVFALLKHGAEAVVLLHHSPKESGENMTLEGALRGSGDMGAFLSACWGTRLQNPDEPYQSPSYLENLKQRDFESRPFEVTCSADCRMHMVGDPATRFVTLASRRGPRSNADGQEARALELIRANIEMPIRDLEAKLAEQGISRGRTWVGRAKARVKTEAA